MDELSFTDRDIRQLAASGSYGRGKSYLSAITNLRLTPGRATAIVSGGAPYTVTLTTHPILNGVCDCPHGMDGNFCKHCVAVALKLLDLEGLPTLLAQTAQRDEVIDTWLGGMSEDQLRNLIHELVDEDGRLRNRLAARAAAAAGDVSEIGESISDLLDTRGFGPYGLVEFSELPRYMVQVHEAIAQLQSLLDSGRAGMAIPAAQHAIEMLADAWGNVADDSGQMIILMSELADVHLTACLAAPPDPVELARWLLDNADCVDPCAYVDLIGQSGLEVLRTDSGLLPRLLSATGDIDGLIELYAADFAANGETHLTIAWELDQIDRHHDAVTWAERGYSHAGTQRASLALVEYLAAEYKDSGRLRELAALRHAEFEKAPASHTYAPYRAAAVEAGTWSAQRAGALDTLKQIDDGGRAYLDALIEDGDIPGAWEYAPGHATDHQWLRLADLIVDDRPADALEIYLARAEGLRDHTGNDYYHALVRVLVKMRDCHERLGTLPGFHRYVSLLRYENKRKRNLITLLDSHAL